MNEQAKFIQQIKSDIDYWLKQSDKATEEIVYGIIFSLLVMIDGDSATNDFHRLKIIDTHNGKRIDCGYLHELFCAALKGDKQ